MRLIPPAPADRTTGSERKVFSLLAQCSLGQNAYALSALNLAEHDYKRWGEIDFLIAMPEGLISLEVKGGEVSCANGVWRFEDRLGRRVEKREAPLAQAQSAHSSLVKNYLLHPFGDAFLRQVPSGFAVVFPFTPAQRGRGLLGGPEMPPELVGFAENVVNAKAIEAFLRGVLAYWRKHMRASYKEWTPEEVKRVVQTLRPSVDRLEPLSLIVARVRQEMLELTKDQYRVLDYLETAPRVLCTGGAGTGKTLIAVECLRREEDAILITGTPMLATHLRAGNVPDPSRIWSFEEVLGKQVELTGQFKTLIVDEGQQITNFPDFKVLERVLGKSLSEGRWRWFADSNRQLSSTSKFAPSANDSLEGWAAVRPHLQVNCRNTPQIVQAVEFLTGAAIGETLVKGSGPAVAYSSSDTQQGCANEAGEQIRAWIRDGEVKPGQILCLSTFALERSSIPSIACSAGLKAVEWKPGWESRPEYPTQLGAATIEDFRGVEAPFVVLCDPGDDDSGFVSNLYIAMTRANFALFIACVRRSREALALRRISKPNK